MALIFSDKRLRAVIIIFTSAAVAIFGLLLLMSHLRASKANESPSNMLQAVAIEPETIMPAPESQDPFSDVTATVNDEVITRQVWQQATLLDAVMSRLARQPIPTAEETLDRLINEIIVLAGVFKALDPTLEAVEARIAALETNWQVTDEVVEAALTEAGLNRSALTDRVRRLIQVEAALNQLTTDTGDINTWLAEARTSTEIGLYHALAENASPPPSQSSTANRQSQIPNPKSPPPDLPIAPYAQNLAPDFTRPQLNGEPLTLSNFRGKPTLINFWASWCPPCRHELPALQAAYGMHHEEVGFIAVDVKEDTGTVAAFVEEMGLSFPVLLDADGSVSDVTYEVRGLPTTLFIDADGVVAARHVGPLDEALIDSYLAPLLMPDDELPATTSTALEVPSASMSISNNHSASANTTESNREVGPASPMVGSSAPDFALTAADGSSIALQDYRDKSTVVLIFYRGHT
jgi:peroxiredoxin